MKTQIAKSGVYLAGALLLGIATAPAFAVDGMSVEVGNGNGTNMARIGIQSDWKRQWLKGENWHLSGYWDLSLGQWHRSGVAAGENADITDIGLTPVFRFQRNALTGPYAEAAIGVHFLSHTTIGDRHLSTSFQFGDHIGVGYRFGAKSAFDLSYRYQHVSNGSIKKPNSGMNFNQIRLQYHF